MTIRQAILHPSYAARKLKEYGTGRTVLYFLKRTPPAVRWHARTGIRAGKIAADLNGYLARRRLAREVVAASHWADYFPESTAFRVAPPGTFEAVDKIIPAANALYRKFMEHHPSGSMDKENFSYILCDFTRPHDGKRRTDLRLYPEFQDLATSMPFVEIACKYLGEVPVIGEVDFQVVLPNDTTEGFQKFHIDRIDRRQLKIFIAVDDVDEGNGATVVVPADVSATLASSIGHRFGRIPDEVVYSEKWGGHVQRAAGPAGTTFLFDTCRTVHCGARTRTRPRLLIMLQYVSKYSPVESFSHLGMIDFDVQRARGNPLHEMLIGER